MKNLFMKKENEKDNEYKNVEIIVITQVNTEVLHIEYLKRFL